MNGFLDAALAYAELGYRVFPCVPNGKAPATAHGCLDATTDTEQIERWWSQNENYNVAIATDGLFVLDVDGKQNPWLQTIDQRELMRGAVQRTPRGGLHFWFKQNGTQLRNTASAIAQDVDTRADGGYVVVCPSVVDGVPYEWLEPLEHIAEKLPTIPEWLVALIQPQHVPLADIAADLINEGLRNDTLTRFAGGLRRLGMTADEIYDSLWSINSIRCRPTLPAQEVRKIADSAVRWEPDIQVVSTIHSHFTDETPFEPDDLQRPEFPAECLENMPRLMRMAWEWGMRTAKKPQPELMLAGLIALFGAVFGRRVRDDYDTRTNIMVLALAPSGSGKEHPRQVNKQILVHTGLQILAGPERIGSHAGLITSVHQHPTRLFQLDEIGRLLQTMRDPGKNPHLYNIGTVLMQLYSSANVVWTGDAYADPSKVKTVDQPCVCVFGTSVPESFYGSLSPDNLSDGMLARLLVIEGGKHQERQKPARMDSIDFLLANAIRCWAQVGVDGNLADQHPRPIDVQKTQEADQRHERYTAEVNDRHVREDDVRAAVWSRAPEKAAKLALIYACCDADGGSPEITLQAEEWGIRLANYSTRLVLANAANTVSGSYYEGQKKKVWRAIRNGMSMSDLTRKTQWLKPRERETILGDLRQSGALELVVEKIGKTQKTVILKHRNTL